MSFVDFRLVVALSFGVKKKRREATLSEKIRALTFLKVKNEKKSAFFFGLTHKARVWENQKCM